MISFIFAMGRNRVIGSKNRLPWHLPADLRNFKEVTLGRSVIMGRLTFESMGKPLPGRRNFIVTQQLDYHVHGAEVIHEFTSLHDLQNEEVFVIGGAKLFESLLQFAKRLYITMIEESFEGDAFFPEIDLAQWRVLSERQHGIDEDNAYEHRYLVLERIEN